MVSVDWNNKRQLYKVQSEDVKTKEVFFDEAQAVISAIGILCVPHYPAELSSIEAFEGEHFHSARWDHSVDLHNKRVAVIGNSCSACVFSFFFCLFVWYRAHFVDVFDVFDTAQIVPAITEDPTTRVINFCRTPFWYLRGVCLSPPLTNEDTSKTRRLTDWLLLSFRKELPFRRWRNGFSLMFLS